MATNSLEQQALDRVARMYSGFDRGGESRPARPAREPQPSPPAGEPSAPLTGGDPVSKPAAAKKPGGLLDTLMEDKEQSLLMLLLVILLKDGADPNTVLALLYLLI